MLYSTTKTLAWQEKVFSQKEMAQYADESNCTTMLSEGYCMLFLFSVCAFHIS